MVADYTTQLFRATDVAAFVFAVLSVLFVVLWRRDNENGMQWLGVAYALLAVHYAFDRWLLPSDLRIHPVSAVVIGLTAATGNYGLVHYLSAAIKPPRWQLVVAIAAPLSVVLCAALGITLYRPWGYLPFVIGFLVLIKVALDTERREPEASHEWLAVGLISVPVYVVVLSILGIDPFYVRYHFMLPAIVVGMLLLTVSLVRRRRALEQENARRLEAERAVTAINASLEEIVARRTADLQNIVAGLESFNRNVSHDLRGSLGGMSGLARAANEALLRDDSSVARRVLPLIAAQAEQSSTLVSSLLTLARVGDQNIRKTQTDLNALTQEVIAQAALIGPEVKLPQFVVTDLPSVFADAELLRPALTNLIGNAIKFCGHKPDACVEVIGRADERRTVVQVRDNGVGFRHEDASVMFEPFTRLHGAAFAGHGIGLSVVRRAIERQGGGVWAEGVPGIGASFFFSLPNRPSDLHQG